jgi:hypothetical protein
MSKVTLDDATRAKLPTHVEHAELFDAAGRRIGHFLSHDAYMKLIYAWAKTEFTDEEAERAWNSYLAHGGVSTREALERAKRASQKKESAA